MSSDPDKYKGFKPSVFKASRESNKPGKTFLIDESGKTITKEQYNKRIEKEESKPKFKRIIGALFNRRAKNLPKGDITKKMKKGGEVTSEFRMGGKVDISNYKGQF